MIRTTYVEFQTSTTIIPQGKNTREELLQQILSPAKKASTMLQCFITLQVLWSHKSKCIQADGGHFEQLALVLNSKSVTVHLTTYLNKYTMLLSPS